MFGLKKELVSLDTILDCQKKKSGLNKEVKKKEILLPIIEAKDLRKELPKQKIEKKKFLRSNCKNDGSNILWIGEL